MGAGSTVAVTTKTSSIFAATGRVPRPSGTRRSSRLVRGSTPTMPKTSPSGSGSSRTRSPTTTRGVSRFAFPRRMARISRPGAATRYTDPSRSRTVPTRGSPVTPLLFPLTGHGFSPAVRRLSDGFVQRGFDIVQREILQPRLGFLRRFSPGQGVSLEMPDRPVPARRPAHKQESGAVHPSDIGLIVHVNGYRIGLTVAAAEGGRPVVLSHVTTQRELSHRPGVDSRTRFPRIKAILAGRSASRRMR